MSGPKITDIDRSSLSLKALAIDAGVVTVDANRGDFFKLLLTENATLARPSNPGVGRRVLLRIKQDNAGARTLSFASGAFRFRDGTAPTVATAANSISYLALCYDEDANVWDVLGTGINMALPS